MKGLLIILILPLTTYCLGQSGEYCGNQTKLKISEIKKRFPYSETTSIKLVSFKYEYPEVESDTGDIEVPVYEPELPKTNGKVDLTKMFETKTLDNKLAKRVMDILVNYDNGDRTREIHFCYEPRNGIIFFDKSDNIVGFVELCFDCFGYKYEPSAMEITKFCDEKFNVLKDVFKEAGIIYGTVRSRD
jgi:hypothetical protein